MLIIKIVIVVISLNYINFCSYYFYTKLYFKCFRKQIIKT